MIAFSMIALLALISMTLWHVISKLTGGPYAQLDSLGRDLFLFACWVGFGIYHVFT